MTPRPSSGWRVTCGSCSKQLPSIPSRLCRKRLCCLRRSARSFSWSGTTRPSSTARTHACMTSCRPSRTAFHRLRGGGSRWRRAHVWWLQAARIGSRITCGGSASEPGVRRRLHRALGRDGGRRAWGHEGGRGVRPVGLVRTRGSFSPLRRATPVLLRSSPRRRSQAWSTWGSAPVVRLDTDGAAIDVESGEAPATRAEPESLAYSSSRRGRAASRRRWRCTIAGSTTSSLGISPRTCSAQATAPRTSPRLRSMPRSGGLATARGRRTLLIVDEAVRTAPDALAGDASSSAA